MLGWSVAIFRESDSRLGHEERWGLRLASWTAGLGGLEWLDQLVSEGAASVEGNGYPFHYTAKARALLPRFISGPPKPGGPVVIGDDYVLPAGYLGEVFLQRTQIDSIRADETIVVEAWDQS